MSLVEYEANNVIPPLKNSDAMKSQACVVVSTAGIVQGLSGLFGNSLGDGHFLTLEADGTKIYVAFSPNSSGSINPAATGNGATICYPIPDGVMMSVRPIAGREVGTGIATMCRYDFLHARVPTTAAVATGYLRIYRSSLAPTQDAGEFRAP